MTDEPNTTSIITGTFPAEPMIPESKFHRLVADGLHLFGKSEHWTAREIGTFAAWLKGRM